MYNPLINSSNNICHWAVLVDFSKPAIKCCEPANACFAGLPVCSEHLQDLLGLADFVGLNLVKQDNSWFAEVFV